MKKLSIFCSALLLMGMVACDDKSDLGIAQSNPQETVLTLGGVTVTPLAPFDASNVIDLNDLKGQTMKVLTYTTSEPVEGTFSYTMDVAPDANFSKVATIELTPGATAADPFTVTAEDFSRAVNELYGLEPASRTVYFRVAGYLTNGTQRYRIQQSDNNQWYMSREETVTPIDPGYEIEAKYYLVSSILDAPVEMTHSDKHQFDDPKFSAVLAVDESDINAGTVTWSIVPESGLASGTPSYGHAEGESATAMSGSIVKGGEAFQFATPARYQIMVNMLDLTFTIQYANDFLYLWGAKGWDNQRLATDNFVDYTGLVNLTGAWMLTGEQNLTSLVVGNGGETGTTENEKTKEITHNGKVVTGKKPFTMKGLYWMNLNLMELTYAATEVKLGLVGGFNNWGNVPDGSPEGTKPEPDVAMTQVANVPGQFEATVEMPANCEWKVRANEQWTISFGAGDASEISDATFSEPCYYNGGNFKTVEAGKYKVVFSFNTGSEAYNMTVTKVD